MKFSKFIKSTLLLITGILLWLPCTSQIYVNLNAGGDNNGSSWENAYTNFQDALDEAKENDQIWVAKGTYLPGKAGDPGNTTFFLSKGVRLYGGFEGTETSLKDRNPKLFPTILSGDLNQDDIANDFENNRIDNVWTVMLVENNSSTLPVIDGFIFKGGHANGEINGRYYQRSGGGLFLFGPAEVRNCEFRQNYANKDGGGLYFCDSLAIAQSPSRMIIDSCHFANNFAENSAGALSNEMINNNTFETYIGHSSFIHNKTTQAGGALLNWITVPNCKVVIEDCHFEKNVGEHGGGIINIIVSSNANVEISNCHFSENRSIDALKHNYITGGGAIRFFFPAEASGSLGSIRRCNFSENSSELGGGAVSVASRKGAEANKVIIDSCKLEKNEADYGGGIALDLGGFNDTIIIKESTLIENKTTEFGSHGGAIKVTYWVSGKHGRTTIENCNFQNNSSESTKGGTIGIIPTGQLSFTSIRNSIFSNNEIRENSSAIYYGSVDGKYELENCTFEADQITPGGSIINFSSTIFSPYMLFLFFHGALWMHIFYFLLVFFITRERTTIYYTLQTIGLSFFYFLAKDFIYFPSIFEWLVTNPWYHYAISKFSIMLSVIAFVKFAQHFLNINQYYPALKKNILYFILSYILINIIQTALFQGFNQETSIWQDVVSWIYTVMSIAGLIIPFLGAIILLRKGYKLALFLFPVLLFVIFCGVFLSLSFNDGSTVSSSKNILISEGFVLLALITLALANGYRINLLKKDKERARQLAELNTAKTRLYNNITHEFRTPLTVIMGTTEMVKGNDPEKELIQRNSQQLLHLINQMLDLSKLEGGAIKLEPKLGDIIPFIEYLVESFQSFAASKHIQLTFFTELESLQMDFDADKIQAIISNLVSNAIKFTPESGKVVIHAKKETVRKKTQLVVTVRDSGSGIPEEDIPHIFDRFFQADASDMRRSEGSGIGLALVKELVQLMNGTIEVTSKVDKGSAFFFSVPITNVAPMETQSFENREVYTPYIPEDETNESFFPVSDELPIALIVEDNRDVVSFLKSCLRKKYALEIAYNGREGIEKALEIVPDIIISDVMMPEADGYTVCKTLKEDERTSHIPIIILTAKATQEDRIQGLD
ncbi:MAG: response regulator, partial [Bacteroidetes bacterium]